MLIQGRGCLDDKFQKSIPHSISDTSTRMRHATIVATRNGKIEISAREIVAARN